MLRIIRVKRLELGFDFVPDARADLGFEDGVESLHAVAAFLVVIPDWLHELCRSGYRQPLLVLCP